MKLVDVIYIVINDGCVVFQMVFYVYLYVLLLCNGDKLLVVKGMMLCCDLDWEVIGWILWEVLV